MTPEPIKPKRGRPRGSTTDRTAVLPAIRVTQAMRDWLGKGASAKVRALIDAAMAK